MSKFNTKTADPFGRVGAQTTSASPIQAVNTAADTRTFEGGEGFTRTDRGQLFLTCTAGFIAEDKFYETGDQTVDRVRTLAASIATEGKGRRKLAGAFTGKAVDAMTGRVHAEEPDTGLGWLLPFVTWLRRKGNMRTAPIVVACEAVHARLAAGIHGGNRELISAALLRADEPGELIAYWDSRFGTRPRNPVTGCLEGAVQLPSCVKRGIGDTLPKLYTEYSALKYDTSAHGVRFGDVLDVVHWTHGNHTDDELYRNTLHTWLLDRRHNRADALEGLGGMLPMVAARARLESIPVADRRALVGSAHLDTWMREAGVTWEWLSGWLSDGKGMDAVAWEAMIPTMGYMAVLRNLRNFDQAGVSDRVADQVADRLADPVQVARSKQFPFRFLSALREVPSVRWSRALDTALTLSTSNVPRLGGRTAIYVDTSGSMQSPMSGRSKVSCVDAATVFGVALAFANQGAVDLYGFADGVFHHELTRGGSLITEVQKFTRRVGEVGYGTDAVSAIKRTFREGLHTRAFIFSDCQVMGHDYYPYNRVTRYRSVTKSVPEDVPLYSFNLMGYAAGITPGGTPNRHELGGLTDATFRLVPVIESAQTGVWPWEMDAA